MNKNEWKEADHTMNHADYVLVFKALADETRLKIIELLVNGPLCACKILENFKITQPTLSYHMKALCDSGLVDFRRDGALMIYSLNKGTLETIRTLFDSFCMVDTDKEPDCTCEEL